MTIRCPQCCEHVRIERLAHGWRFCAACGLSWLVGEDGGVQRQVATSHSSSLFSARSCALSTEARAADV